MSDKQNQDNKPALYVHVKVLDEENIWIGSRIGVAFYHKDGVGLNILLNAQPIPLNSLIKFCSVGGVFSKMEPAEGTLFFLLRDPPSHL